MGFLHGVETITLVVGGQQVTVVKTAVVMLIGYAPKGPAQTLTLVQKDSDRSQFGSPLNGFTIPQALANIFKQGAGTVIVNNVYSSGTNDVAVVSEAQVIASGKIASTYHPTGAVVVKNSGGTTTYVKDTDYSIDDYGNIKIINPALTDGTTLKLSYGRFDTTTVISSQIVGGLSGDVRTGLSLFDECRSQFGFSGKILICPVYCGITAVTTAMLAYVNNKRACTLIHAPVGTSKATAIAGRGSGGTINFNTQNKRAKLIFPWFKDTSAVTDATQLCEPTAYWAGVMCAVDSTDGPKSSESNREIIGVKGSEITITDDINDQNSDANTLNALGIATLSMGSGAPHTWGNRNASYPTNTAIDSFLSVVRLADIIEESIEYFSRPYIDKDITKAVIDQIRDDVNAFLRVLISRGWLIDGLCTWDRTKNPDSELSAGHLVFDYNFLPPPPLERLTYNAFLDIRLFSKLVSN